MLAGESRSLLGAKRQPEVSQLLTGWTGAAVANVQLAGDYVVSSLRRDRRAWCMGILTVTLVVAFSALLQSGIETSPVIFLKLAEEQAGESDALLTPQFNADNTLPFHNWTLVNAALTGTSGFADVAGSAPRWALLANAASRVQPARSASCIVLAIDSDQEASIGLGRAWGRRPLGEGEAYVAQSLLDEVGVSAGVGDRIVVTYSLAGILQEASASAAGSSASGGSTSSANASATSSSANSMLVAALLSAAGINLSTLSIQVSGLTALELAVAGAGLSGAVNISALASALPGLNLFQVDLAPLVVAAVAAAVGGTVVTAPYTVVDGLLSPGGKFPALLGNVVVVEAAYLALLAQASAASIVANLAVTLSPIAAVTGPSSPVAALLATLQALPPAVTYPAMKGYAMQTAIMSTGRLQYYLHGSVDDMDSSLARFSDGVMGALGVGFPASISTPLGDVLDGIKLIALFLSQIFYVTVFVLAVLGAQVIYALVLGDVETRSYETGMLRALGLKHSTLGALLSLQTAAFAVPGILLGLLAATLMNLGVVYGMGSYASIALPVAMPPSAWAVGISLGVVMPALATVVPVRRALSSSLRDALDLYHSSLSEVTVHVTRLAEMGLSPAQIALALTLVSAGFITFYLLPLSFLFNNLGFFLGLLTAVLMAMLCGLALVALVLQPTVETALLRLFLSFGPDAALATVVRKNLSGHRPRNAKTAGMIGLSIAFLVFASAMFGLQGAAITVQVRELLGADIVALVPDAITAPIQLPQAAMTAFLTSEQASSDIVLGWSYVSLPMTTIPFVRRSQLSNLVALPRSNTRLFGVQRNLLSVAFGEYAAVTEASVSGLSLSEAQAVASAAIATGGTAGTSSSLYTRDSVSAYVSSFPIDALYEGAGRARLSIESTLVTPPPPLVTGELDGPVFTCGLAVDAIDASRGWAISYDVLPGRGLNDSNSPTRGLAEAYAAYRACGGAAGCSLSPWTSSSLAAAGVGLAYADFDWCSLACADPSTAGARGSAGANMSVAEGAAAVEGACTAVNASSSSSSMAAVGFPFYGPAAWPAPLSSAASSASGGGGGSSVLTEVPSAPSARCFSLRSPCFAASTYDRTLQRDRVDTAYLQYVDVLMSEALRGAASLSTDTPLQLRLVTRDPATGYVLLRVYMAKARAMLRKLPGFFFSSYSTTAPRSPIIARMTDYARLYAAAQADYATILAWEGRGGGSATSPPNSSASIPVADGGGGGGGGAASPFPSYPTWLNGSSSWLSGVAAPPLAISATNASVPSGSNAGIHVQTWNSSSSSSGSDSGTMGPIASFWLDNDPSTSLLTWTLSPADAQVMPTGSLARRLNVSRGVAAITLDVGACGLASNFRLLPLPAGAATAAAALNSSSSGGSGGGGTNATSLVSVSLYALSDAAASAYQLMGTIDTAFASDPSEPTYMTGGGNSGNGGNSGFPGFSARYWAVLISPSATLVNGAATQWLLAVPDLQLQLSSVPQGTCQADTLSADDSFPLIPKQRLLVRLKPGATPAERVRVLNGIRSTITTSSIVVQDVASLLQSTDVAILGLNIFFMFVAALCLTLCFFASWLSFSANVNENSVELGILRSLGLSVAAVSRVFMYEALIVVLAAFILGSIIGMAVAVSLTLQFGLFTEMPFQFTFPTALFMFTLGASILLALGSSWGPTRTLSKLHIAAVLKGRTR